MTAEMRQVLAELEMLSHGTTASWNHAGGGGPVGSKHWERAEVAPHVFWRERWERAVLKGPVVEAARAELDGWRVRVERPVAASLESDPERDARIVAKLDEGWTEGEVALHCRTSASVVRGARLRAKAAVLVAEGLARSDRALRAAEMRSEGRMSLRQIAFVLGCDVATVHRDLAAVRRP